MFLFDLHLNIMHNLYEFCFHFYMYIKQSLLCHRLYYILLFQIKFYLFQFLMVSLKFHLQIILLQAIRSNTLFVICFTSLLSTQASAKCLPHLLSNKSLISSDSAPDNSSSVSNASFHLC